MAASLIHFDCKHIFSAQLAMVDDHVSEGFIHDMGKSVILEICGHLQAIGFLHTSRMSRGYKLDLTLISTLVERWRPKTYTFHLPCNECTITLEDVSLQIGLLVDGPAITGSTIVPGKVGLYKSLLGKVPDKFEGGRILMNWLKDNFNELPEDLEDRTEEVITQCTQLDALFISLS